MKTLYVSDIDGTLIGNNALPSEFTVRTLNALSKEGMLISVATSRSLSDAKMILENLEFTAPVITMNGTFITDISDKANRKTLHKITLDRKAALKACEILEQSSCPPNVFFFYDEDLDVEYKFEADEHQHYFNELRKKSYRSFKQVNGYNEKYDIVFIAAVGNEQDIKGAAGRIEHSCSFNCTCYEDVYRRGMWFLEITDKKANKAEALKRLKELTGADRVVVFGDNYNDLPMFEIADEKIAVENAVEGVKIKADKIILANTDDGVAKYLLEEFKNR